ncbi:MAG: hypothetical protein DWQ31_11255 [Planctomycetota bacterium]|nr:MAG: hypothetical protein DWQ31_11255 [Planctomycetota bacterium]REJ93470.1 MAG: hypothetical protein DWQ35_10425 [Planctomycetota bacterium]
MTAKWYRFLKPAGLRALGDREREALNGAVHYSSLPSVRCDSCGTIHCRRDVQAWELPPDVEEDLELLSREKPISWARFSALSSRVTTGIGELPFDPYPCGRYLPAIWLVDTPPRGDHHWPYHVRCIVSSRAKSAYESCGLLGMEFVELWCDQELDSPYFDFIVTQSVIPRREEGCDACRNRVARPSFRYVKRFAFVPDAYSSGTLKGIICSERLVDVVRSEDLTNVEFRELDSEIVDADLNADEGLERIVRSTLG